MDDRLRIDRVREQKGVNMYELSVERQQQISGGSALAYIVYALLGIAGLRLLRSAKGRLRVGRLITVEWGN